MTRAALRTIKHNPNPAPCDAVSRPLIRSPDGDRLYLDPVTKYFMEVPAVALMAAAISCAYLPPP